MSDETQSPNTTTCGNQKSTKQTILHKLTTPQALKSEIILVVSILIVTLMSSVYLIKSKNATEKGLRQELSQSEKYLLDMEEQYDNLSKDNSISRDLIKKELETKYQQKLADACAQKDEEYKSQIQKLESQLSNKTTSKRKKQVIKSTPSSPIELNLTAQGAWTQYAPGNSYTGCEYVCAHCYTTAGKNINAAHSGDKVKAYGNSYTVSNTFTIPRGSNTSALQNRTFGHSLAFQTCTQTGGDYKIVIVD